MEDFSKDEISKLEQFKKLFKVEALTRQQIEVILGRKLEQPKKKQHKTKSMPKFTYSQIAQHAAKKGFKENQEKRKLIFTFQISSEKVIRIRSLSKLRKLESIKTKNFRLFALSGKSRVR